MVGKECTDFGPCGSRGSSYSTLCCHKVELHLSIFCVNEGKRVTPDFQSMLSLAFAAYLMLLQHSFFSGLARQFLDSPQRKAPRPGKALIHQEHGQPRQVGSKPACLIYHPCLHGAATCWRHFVGELANQLRQCFALHR